MRDLGGRGQISRQGHCGGDRHSRRLMITGTDGRLRRPQLFDCLAAAAVPLLSGPANAAALAPPGAVVLLDAFPTPAEAAASILEIDRSGTGLPPAFCIQACSCGPACFCACACQAWHCAYAQKGQGHYMRVRVHMRRNVRARASASELVCLCVLAPLSRTLLQLHTRPKERDRQNRALISPYHGDAFHS